jgi:hypothetical protein
MALAHSPQVVTNGLVYYYDMSNTQKSWKGAPTTNLFGDAVNYAGLNSYWYLLNNATNYFLLSSSYNSWCMSYGCTLAASTQYTVSFEYKTSLAGTLTIDNDGVDDNTWNATINTITSWQKYTFTRTQITAGALTLYFRRNTGGDIEVRNVQIEAGAFATPFVKGSRTNTQAIVDLTGVNTVTATSLTYASDNTFSFNGTGSISFTNPLSAQTNLGQEWTVIAWVNIDTSINQRLIIGLNSSLYLTTGSNTSLLYLNGGVNDYYTYGGAIGGVGWCQVVFRFRNSDGARTIYKNGVNISTGGPNLTSIPSGNSGTFTLGTAVNGLISNTMIYNRYITDAEVKQNFNALRGRYGL